MTGLLVIIVSIILGVLCLRTGWALHDNYIKNVNAITINNAAGLKCPNIAVGAIKCKHYNDKCHVCCRQVRLDMFEKEN